MNDLVKIHLPHNDPYIMGKKPEVKRIINATINKVKAISDLANDSNVKYLCEEVIADLEDLKLEIHKL
jgi:hypothetical protein